MWRTALALGCCLSACGSEAQPDDGPSPQDLTLEREFTGIRVAPATESTDLCASWRLDNDRVLYVNQVDMEAGAGWHHSNWFFVPEATFSEDDGVWRCGVDFDAVKAALTGGVLFAQSTQATDETQGFQQGAA